MQVRRLNPDDVAFAIHAVTTLKPEDERAGQTASPAHMQRFLSRPQNHLIVAIEGDLPVGFLLAYELDRVDRDQTMIYLYEIDVSEPYQRRGIGTAMVNLLKEECRGRGVKEIWVGTWESNEPAARFYEATGARREPDLFYEFVYPGESLEK